MNSTDAYGAEDPKSVAVLPQQEPAVASQYEQTSSSCDQRESEEFYVINSSEGQESRPEAMPQSSSQNQATDPDNQTYRIKWISWNEVKTPIIMQNENGPCPLIAIVNVSLLRGQIHLDDGIEYITGRQLMTHLGDLIIRISTQQKLAPELMQNYEQIVSDALGSLDKFMIGLMVNVKFVSVTNFENTPELAVFDVLNVPLYHGWLLDPQDTEIVKAVNGLSFNQLVEKIITGKESSDEKFKAEAALAEQFYEDSRSQLTYYGLYQLQLKVRDGELAVLFRNNHFYTLYKHHDKLFFLATDVGFLDEPNYVWETLNSVVGDSQHCDANFHPAPPKPELPLPTVSGVDGIASSFNAVPPLPEGATKEQQIDHDYLLALSLEQESKSSASGASSPRNEADTYDHHLAMQLQREEEALAEREQQKVQPKHQQRNSHPHPQQRDQELGPGPSQPRGEGSPNGNGQDSQRRRGEVSKEKKSGLDKCSIM